MTKNREVAETSEEEKKKRLPRGVRVFLREQKKKEREAQEAQLTLESKLRARASFLSEKVTREILNATIEVEDLVAVVEAQLPIIGGQIFQELLSKFLQAAVKAEELGLTSATPEVDEVAERLAKLKARAEELGFKSKKAMAEERQRAKLLRRDQGRIIPVNQEKDAGTGRSRWKKNGFGVSHHQREKTVKAKAEGVKHETES